ncbi:MAG: KamA family radical SAM protein [Bdellovibrionaceae bacterium]|nr:KamA family radical SAM protein [Pseudobdellovibrionaceae bacterium]
MARFVFPSSRRPDGVDVSDWTSWTWQLRHALKNKNDFERVFKLSPGESEAFEQGREIFNIRCTPYYASLAGDFEEEPIRRILMPHRLEMRDGTQQMADPLGEKRNQAAPRLVHRYSDRALFLITDFCSVYCRHCTRKHFTGREQALIRPSEYEEALSYIASHPGVREVILSGGDPLTIADGALERILADLRAIEHVEIIRVGTRMPVVAPMRVTDELVRILHRHGPVYLMTHFNHPRELTAEAAQALGRLVDGGIPVMNQMVLLNGVNNHAAIVQALSRRLLFLRVKPYYMFQCDPSVGTDHLRTSIDESLEIQKELWGHLSGLAMPTYAVDIPEGGGKTVLTPNFEIARDEHSRRYRGWDGVEASYVNPAPERRRLPADAGVYADEWNEITRSRKY